MEILLDTNFVIMCVKQKIDFFSVADEMINEKIKWIVPFEVLEEIKLISTRRGEKTVDKDAAKLSLEVLKLVSTEIINVKNRNVDQGIINYIKGKDIVLATMDRGLKSKVKNNILTIRDFKTLEII